MSKITRTIKNIRFALKHDFYREFVIVEAGEMPSAIRFLYYEDAVKHADKLAKEKPQYGYPQIMIPLARQTKD